MVTDACRLPFCVETTAPGRGAISVVEVVGRSGWSCVKKLIPARTFKRCPGIALVELVGQDGPIDQAIIAHVPASEALSGHETIEINTHGGPSCVGRLVDALRKSGVPLRNYRHLALLALKSRKLDLIQLEALDLVRKATTFRAASFLMRQFNGGLSGSINRMLDRLVLCSASGRRPSWRTISRECTAVLRAITRLLSSAELGLALALPARCVIAGSPNVGKSSLFNSILGYPRAIVHPEAGTTRDHVEEMSSHKGIPFLLVDTAGLGPTDCAETEDATPDLEIRKAAEACSLAELRKARILLHVRDARTLAAPPPDPAEPAAIGFRMKRNRTIVVVNKIDLLSHDRRTAIERSYNLQTIPPHVLVSALTGEGLDTLRNAICDLLAPGSLSDQTLEAGIFTPRQRRILLRLQRAVRSAAIQARLRNNDTIRTLRHAVDTARSLLF